MTDAYVGIATQGHRGSNASGDGTMVPSMNEEAHTLQGWEHVTMCKGLSKYQAKVMEEMGRKGCLDIFEVSDIVWSVHHSDKDEDEKGFFETVRMAFRGEVSSMKDFSMLYRMMRSLERRGMVARVLHMRPARWFHIESWSDSLPNIDLKGIRDGAVLMAFVRRGKLEFRSKGKVYSMSYNKFEEFMDKIQSSLKRE